MRMLIFTPLLCWTFSPEHLFTFFVFFHQWAPVHSEPAIHPSRRFQKPYQVCTQVWWQTFPTLTPLTRAKQIRQTVSVTSHPLLQTISPADICDDSLADESPGSPCVNNSNVFCRATDKYEKLPKHIYYGRLFLFWHRHCTHKYFFNVLLSFFLFLFSFDDGVTPKDQMLQSEMFLAGPRTFPRVLVDFSGMDHVWSRACFNQRH